MTNDTPAPVGGHISDLKTSVTEGVKAAISTLGETIEDGKRPGKQLDMLSKMTREAPLGMLLGAFLIGRALARRRW